MPHSVNCSGCPECSATMREVIRMDTAALSRMNTTRSEAMRNAQAQNRQFRTSCRETVDQRAARLTGFWRAAKPRAATVETDPKPAPKAPSMVERIQRQAAKNSVREIAGVPQRFPVRVPEAERFVRPIATQGEVLDASKPAPPMPDLAERIRARIQENFGPEYDVEVSVPAKRRKN